MIDNLDDFLRQAAQRRAQRQQEKNTSGNPRNAPSTASAPPSASAPPASSTRQTPRPRQVFNSPNAPAPTRSAPAPSTPSVIADTASTGKVFGSFEPSLSRRHVESDLEYADERMEAHLNEAFSSSVRTKDGVRTLRQSEPASGSTGGQASKQLINAGDLKQQLRNPQTLRLAILAQEVLKRPYQ